MNPLVTIVALMAAGLGTVIGFELLPSATEADPVPPAASAAGIATAPSAAAAIPKATVSDDALLARPLFSQTRRPPNVAGPAATAVARMGPLPRMTAILIDGPNRRAIFAGSEGGKAVTVVEGGHVGAFTVQSIGPQQVTLVGPDGPRTVRTTFDASLQPPVTTPVAGFIPPQFPGIQMPGMPVPPPNPPYSQSTTPAFDAGNGSFPGAAR